MLTCFLSLCLIKVSVANQVTVDANEGIGDYTSLTDALHAGASDIVLHDGVYDIESTITLDRPNIRISGTSKANTILRYIGTHTFLSVVNTEHITVSELTLDALTFDSDSNVIWEAFGVFNSSFVQLTNCIVYGSNHMFAVFFAGPYFKWLQFLSFYGPTICFVGLNKPKTRKIIADANGI